MLELIQQTPQVDEYIIDCLKAAVAYCKSQYVESEIDWLPTVALIGLKDESVKYKLIENFVNSL